MVTKLNEHQTHILGAAIIELLNGELTDETIAAVDSINRDAVPEPLNNLVGMMHGMSNYEPIRQDIIAMLLTEIGGAANEAKENLYGRTDHELEPGWIIATLLFQVLESEHHSELIDEMLELMPDPERAGWAAPLTSHARRTKARGKELTLELLDVLERIIKKRREELS